MAKVPDFKQRVIKATLQIPKGRVTTYGTLAVMAGLPRGARLVGGILHFNSDEYNLPWHRVINRMGYISTNCHEHQKVLQKALLEQEGIAVNEDFVVDLNNYGWWGE